MPTSAPTQQPVVKHQAHCRICKSRNLVTYFDFGEMPLANRNLSAAELDVKEPVFPLQLMLCADCKLSQLSVVIAPEILYQEYPYYSSVSESFRHHCRDMVTDLKDRLKLAAGDCVVEIASNDGCLLSQFAQAGFRVAGVEPAPNLAAHTNALGLTTFCRFWGSEAAGEIRRACGSPALIVGTNVLAHVDDLDGFLCAVRGTLAPEGYFVFEVPYMANYIEQLEFDTTYHEHLSYFLLHPLKRVLEANGLRIVDVEEFNIHGGSIRVICCKDSAPHGVSANVGAFLALEQERGLLEKDIYVAFAGRIYFIRDELRRLLSSLKHASKSIAAYGASAKGNVLLNYCGIGKDTVGYIIDDTPMKQGKFQSGTHIPIVGPRALAEARPDYLVILAWNFSREIMHKTDGYNKAGGSYIIPLPNVTIIDSSCPDPTEAAFL